MNIFKRVSLALLIIFSLGFIQYKNINNTIDNILKDKENISVELLPFDKLIYNSNSGGTRAIPIGRYIYLKLIHKNNIQKLYSFAPSTHRNKNLPEQRYHYFEKIINESYNNTKLIYSEKLKLRPSKAGYIVRINIPNQKSCLLDIVFDRKVNNYSKTQYLNYFIKQLEKRKPFNNVLCLIESPTEIEDILFKKLELPFMDED